MQSSTPTHQEKLRIVCTNSKAHQWEVVSIHRAEWKILSISFTNVQTSSIQWHYEQCSNLKYNKASTIHGLLITNRDIHNTKIKTSPIPKFPTLTRSWKQKIQREKTWEYLHVNDIRWMDVGGSRGRSRILKRGFPVCTWLLYLAKRAKHAC